MITSRFARLTGFTRPYSLPFAISLAGATLASILDGVTFALLIPFLRALFGASPLPASATVVENLLVATVGEWLQGDAAVVRAMTLIVVVVGLKNLALYASSYLAVVVEEGVARDLRVKVHESLLRQDVGFFQSVRAGQLISRALADADQAKTLSRHLLETVLRNVVLVSVYLAILFSLSWRLTLFSLALVPLLGGLLRPLLRGTRERLRAALDERGELTALMQETIAGARLIKAHGAERYESRRFRGAADRFRGGILATQRVAILASPLSETLAAGMIAMLLIGAGWLAAGPAMRPELFVIFLAVTVRLLPPVKSLSQFPAWAEQALSAADRIFEVVDRRPPPAPAGTVVFDDLRDGIEFRDVWVSYGEEWVLRGVDLQIRKGEVVALVGESGAGKSTLLDLIPRFLEPTRGEIGIDGVALSRYTPESLRRRMAIVGQETVIFNDTVLANIAYGLEQVDGGAVRRAAEVARAAEFIERLPERYETVLGERGTRLSGGERQRIALARAILRDPSLLILDEATSALDPESDLLVREAIEDAMWGRTVMLVAHRLSTVSRADRVVVLDRGRVVESGAPSDLLMAGGRFERMARLSELPV